jgi:hypothetical protein
MLEAEQARIQAEAAAKVSKAGVAAVAPAAVNPIAHLTLAQQKAVVDAAAKAKMTVAAYYTWLMNRQKAAKAAGPVAAKKPDGSAAA